MLRVSNRPYIILSRDPFSHIVYSRLRSLPGFLGLRIVNLGQGELVAVVLEVDYIQA